MRFLALLAVLLSSTPAFAQATEAKKDDWAGTVGAGLILLTGNSSTLTTNLTASAKRSWEAWSVEAKAGGVYGRNRAAAPDAVTETTALGATTSLRVDRKLAEHVTVFVIGGVDTDHVASLEYRAFGEGGAGYVWIDRKEEGDKALLLRTDLGFRYANDSRWQYYGVPPAEGRDLPDVELVAPRLALAFRWQGSKELVFSEDAEYLPNVKGDSRFLVKSVTKLTSRLVGAVSFGVTYRVTYDSAPAPGAQKADTLLGLTLETAF